MVGDLKAAAMLGLKADQVRASGVCLAGLVGRLAEQQLVAPFTVHLHLRGGVGKRWQSSAAPSACEVVAQCQMAMRSAHGDAKAALADRGRCALRHQCEDQRCHHVAT